LLSAVVFLGDTLSPFKPRHTNWRDLQKGATMWAGHEASDHVSLLPKLRVMDNGGLVVIIVTSATQAEAEKLRDALLKARQAACVSIISKVSSAYWWQGHTEAVEECLLILKTRASQIDRIVELVRRNHSYTVPEVVAMPVVGGNPEYLDWIRKEVSE
jgi:periplasmic divalent cation tolerance protein